MKSFNFNIDSNISLDKLYTDANKNSAVDLGRNSSSDTAFQVNVGNNYNNSFTNNRTETLDLTTNLDDSKSANINTNNSNNINNSGISQGTKQQNANVNVNTTNMNNSSTTTTTSSQTTINNSSSNSSQINVNNSQSSMETQSSQSSTNSNSININNNSNNKGSDLNLETNEFSKNNINQDDKKIKQTSANINNSGGSNGGVSKNPSATSNVNSSNNNNNSNEVSIDVEIPTDTETSDDFVVKDGKVVITTINQEGNQEIIEIDLDEYKNNLKMFGIIDEDIDRIIKGEITLENLIKEIENDPDNTRKNYLMESSYLQAFGLEYTSLSQLTVAKNKLTEELKKKLEERAQYESREYDSIMDILIRLQTGESLENILKTIVAYQYTDENGNIKYVYDDPFIHGNYDGKEYIALTFEEMYKDSEILEELKSKLSVKTINPLFGKEYTVHYWEDTTEQINFYDEIGKKYNTYTNQRKSILENINSEIETLQQQIDTYTYIENYIANAIKYQNEFIDPYINKIDFESNKDFNPSSLDKLNEIKNFYNNNLSYQGGAQVDLYTKDEIISILSCMINNQGNIKDGTLKLDTTILSFHSADPIFEQYTEYIAFMTDDEKSIFNYIYNTEGTDEAYKYLEDISTELDIRWLANKTQEDQKFANEHPILASIGSVIVTPFEGMKAVYYSISSKINGEKIKRMDVYSAGNIWRAQVGQDIANNYGERWAFAYNTGMSMADSVSLIGLTAITGGVATPVLSASIMGTRVYVSTLNDALDRGLSDSTAIGLAFASAITETIMESYSVGHLLNLENTLGKNTAKLVGQVADNITNPTLANIATKSVYIVAGALSQGICEGEEEFATEIANYVTDCIISKDLSNHTVTINKYIELGYSEEEARKIANINFASNLQQAFLGGFVSGVCFGTFGGAKTTNRISKDIASNIMTDFNGTKVQAFAQAIETNQINQEIAENFQKQQTKEKINNLTSTIKEIFNNFQNKENTGIEIATKIEDFVKPEEIIYESSDVVVNNLILEQIEKVTSDLQSFANLLSKIRQYTNENIPDGYSSVEDYKKEFIKTLLNSGKINELDNNYIYQLARDPIMLSELIGVEKLENLYIKNLTNFPKLLVPTLSALKIEDFNRLFNSEAMINYINSLSSKELSKILKFFNQTNSSNVSWLANSTILNKISNFSIEEFYSFIGDLGYYSYEIRNYIKTGNETSNYLNLLKTIQSKFYTQDIILTNLEYKSKIDNIVPNLTHQNKSIDTELNKITDVRKKVENIITNKIISSSNVKIEETIWDVNLIVDPSYKYYDVTIEVNGQEKTIELSQTSGKISIKYKIIDNIEYATAALNDSFKIKSVNVNYKKSNLVFTEEQGLIKGINEVTLLLDGIEKKILVNLEKTSKDLNFDYQKEFAEVKDLQIKSIQPIGNFNIDIDDPSALYKVSYEIDGIKFEKYINTSNDYFSNVGENTLNINDIISKNNLIGIKNINVTKANIQEIKENFPIISKYQSSSDIYNIEKYGGNQSDVYTIISNLLDGKELTSINMKKAEILTGLIDKYFPNTTDIQKINLATLYANGGCCWMAVANAFATYMGNLENGTNIFKNKIGFELAITDGTIISYNLEALAFDMYLAYFSKIYKGNIADLLSTTESTGVSALRFNEQIVSYFTEHSINIESDTSLTSTKEKNIDNELIKRILNNKDCFSILSATNFDLKLLDKTQKIEQSLDRALENAKTEGDIKKGIGGHAMLVTGIDENMNLLVSSWGKEYQFLSKSIEEHKSLGQSANASIWTIKFSLPTDNIATSNSINGNDATTFEAFDKQLSQTQLLRNNYNLQNITYYVNNAIQTMNQKYQGKGIERIEKYLITGDINHITRDNNCRSYISSLSKNDLTKALNIIISENRMHSLLQIKNNLTPQEAINMYNNLIDLMNRGNGAYNYYEYINYVNYCQSKGISYFINHQFLEIPNQLEQLKNQFNYSKKYFSLKTKEDIFSYFGSMTNSMYNKVIEPIKEISSFSSQNNPISGYDLEKIKDINYIDFLFSKKSKNLDNYLSSVNNNWKNIGYFNKKTIINYLNQSVQGQFLLRLTVKEVLAIYEYTVGSGTILKYLTGNPIDPHFRIKDPIVLNNIIEGLDSAILKYGGLNQNMILYRGDDFKKLSMWKNWKVNNYHDLLSYVGKTVKCETYMSTGVSESGSFEGEVKWKIKAPVGTKGMYINDLSKYFDNDTEFEYLVSRGSEFRIDNVYQKVINTLTGSKTVTYIEAKIIG